jgi:hypothetical protein
MTVLADDASAFILDDELGLLILRELAATFNRFRLPVVQ